MATRQHPATNRTPVRPSGQHVGWAVVVGLLIGTAILGIWWVGHVEWEAPQAVGFASATLGRWVHAPVTIGRLWIIPCRQVRATDVVVTPAGGGRLHAESVFVRYRLGDLLRGHLTSRWRIQRVRIDPGSWHLKRRQAVATLSERPVADTVTMRLTWRPPHLVTLHYLRILGPFLRAEGQGTWSNGTVRLWILGQAACSLLRDLGVPHSRPRGWEPIVLRLNGPVRRPALSLKVRKFSFQMGMAGLL